MRPVNAADGPAASGGYAQAIEVTGMTRLVFISGQIPVAPDGATPLAFAEQCTLVWANVEAQLRAAGMTLDHLVKVTTFLADRAHATQNGEIRRRVLGDRTPALTVLIAGIFDQAWLIEIEAIAAN